MNLHVVSHNLSQRPLNPQDQDPNPKLTMLKTLNPAPSTLDLRIYGQPGAACSDNDSLRGQNPPQTQQNLNSVRGLQGGDLGQGLEFRIKALGLQLVDESLGFGLG